MLHTPFDYHYPLATDTQRLRDTLNFSEPVVEQDALRQTAASAGRALADAPPARLRG